MKFKDKKDYTDQRKILMDNAKALLTENNQIEAATKMAEVEALDKDYEEWKLENANEKALNERLKVLNLENKSKTAEGVVMDDMSDIKDNGVDKFYKNAFLKKLQGKELDASEMKAYTSDSSSGGAVIPTDIASQIIEKMKQQAPLLDEITLLNVKGNLSYAVEGITVDADVHAENAQINVDADTMVKVTLSAYEITKLVQISKTVATMAIDTFEKWLVNVVARGLVRKINKLIINGSGTDEATGINKANIWDETNSVKLETAATLTNKDVLDLISLLNGSYDATSKFLMSKKTLFTDFMPLQDLSKNKIVTREGNKYFVYGYEVMQDDTVERHEAFLGDYSVVVGNMSEDITVESGFDINTNSYKYLGCCMFDCKPAIGEAFVKLARA